MTKKEFITRNEARSRAIKQDMRLSLVLAGLIFFPCLIAIRFIEEHKWSPWLGLFLASIMLAIFPAFLWHTSFLEKRRHKRFGLQCPSCNKPLTGANVQIAIATGNCGHCGESVFDE